jgi:MFS transporter, ACS family, D-galactonate transporter
MSTIQAEQASPPTPINAKGGIWGRQLGRYPANGPRAVYLGIVIIVTIMLYYELYVGGSVATLISQYFNMSLAYLITVSIIGGAVGAVASVVAGAADRWGRANLVVYGVLATALLVYSIAFVQNKTEYLLVVVGISFVEGMVLVATPALIRDFSPQLGRASAMGFWTLGPVMGSLVVTEVSSHTLPANAGLNDWQFQFKLCGIVGAAVFVIAFFGLRELAPQLRDQLMVSLRDKFLIELKARGIDPAKAIAGHWRQMLRWDIIGPAFAISVFLLFYYIAVGLFVVFFATNYGYSLQQANSLANWYWSIQAIALILTGIVSDWLKVRKPFMVIGGLISTVGVVLFALNTKPPAHAAPTQADTNHWIYYILLISIGGAIAFAAWMAAFTETVEKHNPAGTATGLAVWGATIRIVVVFALTAFIFAVPAANPLVNHGGQVAQDAAGANPQLTATENKTLLALVNLGGNPTDTTLQATAISAISGVSVSDVGKVITLSTQDADQLKTAQAIDPATAAGLLANPTDPTLQAAAVGQIASKLGISVTDAIARLVALSKVPTADLLFLSQNGPLVQKAGTALTTMAKGPLQNPSQYGPGLDQAVMDQLAFLQKYGAQVQQAAKDSPAQWQRWWWVCVGGQIAFLFFIGLMVGRWSPKKAREDAKAHEEAVNRELAALAAAPPASAGATA